MDRWAKFINKFLKITKNFRKKSPKSLAEMVENIGRFSFLGNFDFL